MSAPHSSNLPIVGVEPGCEDARAVDVVCYGAAGHAIIYLIGLRQQYPLMRVRAFVDDFNHGFTHPDEDAPVISAHERQERFPDVPVVLAINDPAAREKIYWRLVEEGALFFTTSGHPRLAHHSVVAGEGTIVDPATRIGPRVRLGRAVSAIPVMMAHDVEVGDFTSIGTGSTILGNVKIGARVNVAPNAVITNGYPGKPRTIGDGCVIGVGAVVTRDLAAGEIVVGNPAMSVAEWRELRTVAQARPSAAEPGRDA